MQFGYEAEESPRTFRWRRFTNGDWVYQFHICNRLIHLASLSFIPLPYFPYFYYQRRRPFPFGRGGLGKQQVVQNTTIESQLKTGR